MISYYTKEKSFKGGNRSIEPTIRMSIRGGIRLNKKACEELKITTADKLVLASKKIQGKQTYLVATDTQQGFEIKSYGRKCLAKVNNATYVKDVLAHNGFSSSASASSFLIELENSLIEDGLIFYPIKLKV